MRQRRHLPLAALAAALLAITGTATSTAAWSAPSSAESAASARQFAWQLTPTGSAYSAARFRGLSAVSRSVAWVSGTSGTVLRTTDGGETWKSVGPPGTELLQLRDIEATSARHAVVLSIGEGTDSRVYVTDDGGATWGETFRNHEAAAFYDCMAFSSPTEGLALSDPVNGKFRLIRTSDGGHSWSRVSQAGMPVAKTGEFAFAASGTCLTAGAGRSMYIGSGGVDPGRVYTSHDLGRTWSVTGVPLAGGPAAGVFSVRFRDDRSGIAVGGDYLLPTGATGNAAWTADGGVTWKPAAKTPAGYRSGSAWLPLVRTGALAVGPSGSDVTLDSGRTWQSFDSGSFDSVECASDGTCWASGEMGRVGRLVPDNR